MVAPGSIESRYDALAGDENRKLELYLARRRLGFTINEWRALPWWQRRVYLEGLHNEAEQRSSSGSNTRTAGQDQGLRGADAILYGSAADLKASGFGT